MPTSRYEDSVCIVTGAAGGFGRQLCLQLSELGAASISLCDINKEAGDGGHFLGSVHTTLPVYQAMAAQGSSLIVIIASVTGLVPCPGIAPYVAAKHALVGFAQTLRAEGYAKPDSISSNRYLY